MPDLQWPYLNTSIIPLKDGKKQHRVFRGMIIYLILIQFLKAWGSWDRQKWVRVMMILCYILFFIVLECGMVLNATFNNISVTSWRSVLLVEETGVPGENHR
jgi:hypothetical protein